MCEKSKEDLSGKQVGWQIDRWLKGKQALLFQAKKAFPALGL